MKKQKIFERIKKEKNQMHQFLHNNDFSPATREKLQEQLKWFTHQERAYQNAEDLEVFIDKFNWMVKNFNDDLELPPEMRFTKFFADRE